MIVSRACAARTAGGGRDGCDCGRSEIVARCKACGYMEFPTVRELVVAALADAGIKYMVTATEAGAVVTICRRPGDTPIDLTFDAAGDLKKAEALA